MRPKSAEGNGKPVTLSQPQLTVQEQRQRALEELERVLLSPAFRASKQCQKFLRYVVEQSLDGREDLLHERTIGVEVFGRDPAYDTGEDPIVRVRANEIRKRLAQYYVESGSEREVRFELSSGSYLIGFRWAAEKGKPEEAAVKKGPERKLSLSLRLLAGITGVAVVVLGASLWLSRSSSTPGLDEFWAPVLRSSKPVFICSGHPVVYFLSRRIHERFQSSHAIDPQAGPYVIKLEPDEAVQGRDIVPVRDQYVGVGDARTAAQLSALFATMQKPHQIRFGNDISFADLRNAPAVLIGAFSNRWTMQMTDELRFVFEVRAGVKGVRDRFVRDKKWELPNIAADGRTPEDYAIVSRVFDSKTGELLISAAGITQYGTQAAGEFLTDTTRIEEAVRSAPSDWPKRNMQVLLHTKVVGQTPGPPGVVAAHFW